MAAWRSLADDDFEAARVDLAECLRLRDRCLGVLAKHPGRALEQLRLQVFDKWIARYQHDLQGGPE